MYAVGGMPVYILDWTGRLNGGDDALGNFPAERFDGDGWYIYVPMQLWQYDGAALTAAPAMDVLLGLRHRLDCRGGAA